MGFLERMEFHSSVLKHQPLYNSLFLSPSEIINL